VYREAPVNNNLKRVLFLPQTPFGIKTTEGNPEPSWEVTHKPLTDSSRDMRKKKDPRGEGDIAEKHCELPWSPSQQTPKPVKLCCYIALGAESEM
jgi:hypothetical protein